MIYKKYPTIKITPKVKGLLGSEDADDARTLFEANRYKKYAGGGYDYTSDFTNEVNSYAKVGQFAASTLQNIAPDSALADYGGGALSGAAIGASIGAVAGPVGAVVGGAVGLVGGIFGAAGKRKKEQLARQQAFDAQQNAQKQQQATYDKSVLDTYNTKGNDSVYSYYKYGGNLKKFPDGGLVVDDGIRNEWNNFQDYLKTNNLAGSPTLDNRDTNLGVQYLNNYKKLNPNSKLTYDYVKPIQQDLQDYRAKSWQQVQAGKMASDAKDYNQYMGHLSQPDGWLGSKTSNSRFPRATFNNKDIGFAKPIPPEQQIMQTPKLAEGGAIPSAPSLTGQGSTIQLASDTHKYVGPSHANGGIPIDTTGNGVPNAEVEGNEVQSGNQIYSNRLLISPMLQARLKASKVNLPSNSTYADVAAKLGKLKGKFEEKLDSHSPVQLRTGKAMVERYGNLLQDTFVDQEQSKVPQFAYGGTLPKYPDGGRVGGTRTRAMADYEDYLRDKNNSIGRGDKDVNIYDYMQRKFVPRTPPPLPPGYKEATDSQGKYYLSEAPRVPDSRPYLDVTQGFNKFVAPPTNDSIGGTSGSWTPDAIPDKISNALKAPISNVSPLTKSGNGRYKAAPIVRSPLLTPASTAMPINDSLTTKLPSETMNIAPIPTISSGEPRPSFMDGVNNAINDYGADAINLASYIGNNSRIAGMKAPTFNYNAAPNYDYRDRSGLAKYENAVATKNAQKSVMNTSSQGNQAQQQALFAQNENANNEINNTENQRYDSYNNNYNARASQVNQQNTDIANRQADVTTQVSNDKIAMGIQAQNAFNQGEIQNQATRSQQALDDKKAAYILASMPDVDKGTEYLNSITNDPVRRRKIQLMVRGGN